MLSMCLLWNIYLHLGVWGRAGWSFSVWHLPRLLMIQNIFWHVSFFSLFCAAYPCMVTWNKVQSNPFLTGYVMFTVTQCTPWLHIHSFLIWFQALDNEHWSDYSPDSIPMLKTLAWIIQLIYGVEMLLVNGKCNRRTWIMLRTTRWPQTMNQKTRWKLRHTLFIQILTSSMPREFSNPTWW
jgi:hypothetical protein